ncbi:MAG TPA: D-glycero-beta-D-manno-heptose-7-phosphate kinase [Verrucomicrobiae bacterium]|jgi:D-beta-D-heptose 7-phosphate kinase/D-beta-D-heptose 1-phosphate adenosyltransferase|nr:D-glycero-beta-D-manno-heptose-7-phosphate kinase [Verrucomicrobiae bacterium]
MSKAVLKTRGISLNAKEKKRLLDLLKTFAKSRVLVVGDFILDQFVWGSVNRISPEAPVPVVNVIRESYMPGGALNVANNVRTLGGTVYPCGVVGRDLEGRMLLKTMRREGIETGGVVYDSSRRTSLKTRVIAHSQQVVRFDREKADDISEKDLTQILAFIKKKIPATDVVIIEDYGKGVIQPKLLKQVVAFARKHKKPVLVDPKEKNFPYYKGVTCITPNRKEAYGALENGRAHHDLPLKEAARRLRAKLNSEAVLITLGEDGMALYERNGSFAHIPTTAQEVFDVSGAGDTVISVFALAMAAGAPMKEAAIISNIAAGLVVAKLGTATVTPEEIQKSIEQM